MINTLLIEGPDACQATLESILRKSCPFVNGITRAGIDTHASEWISCQHPDLVIMDTDFSPAERNLILRECAILDLETILVTGHKEYLLEALQFHTVGFVQKPVVEIDLIIAVSNACKQIERKEENLRNRQLINKMMAHQFPDDLIGVPSFDGFDFVRVREIIRCEGLQKWTRIVTRTRSNLVSSYNIGEFRRLLEPFGFFSPHKSHLINMSCLVKYKREGTVILSDGSSIPVSKRRKKNFLDLLRHV